MELNTYKPRSLFLLSLFLFFLFGLHLCQNLCVMLTSLFKLFFEFIKVFFWSEFDTEFLGLWLLIWNIISSPCPWVVTCFKLFEFTEDVFSLKQVIDNDFVSFFSSNKGSDKLILLVWKEFQLSDSSKKLLKKYLSFHYPLHL
jgi:hypothetical protein